jgi:hypothetical protein
MDKFAPHPLFSFDQECFSVTPIKTPDPFTFPYSQAVGLRFETPKKGLLGFVRRFII